MRNFTKHYLKFLTVYLLCKYCSSEIINRVGNK